MANSIDLGSARVPRLQLASSDGDRAIDLRITGVIRKGASEATPASAADEFHVGDTLIGSYVATDRHFLHTRLHLQPKSKQSPPRPSSPPLFGQDDGDRHLNPHGQVGGTWTLDTTHMQASDYVLTLQAVDRTMLGSSTVTRWSSSVALDFCLSPARSEPLSALSATSHGRGFSHVRRM